MRIELPTGDVVYGMPVMRCHVCGGDRPTYTAGGVTHCAACLRPITPLSPVEEYLSRHITAAVNEATRAPDAAGDTGLTPPSFQRKDNGMSIQPDTKWRDLKPGAVIIADPNHPDVLGEWTVVDTPNTNGWDVFTHVRCASGCERTFHTFQNTQFAVRPAETTGGAA